jgi:outer membrane cobalamin receptor
MLGGSLAWAQDLLPGRIQGRVLDHQRGTPVPEAMVYLDVGPLTRTDDTGAFLFEGVPPGVYGIAAVGPGCATAIGQATVEPAGEMQVDFRLDIPESAVSRAKGEEEEASSGQAGAWVQVVTGEEIRNATASNLLDLLRARVPGLAGGVSSSSEEAGRLRVRGNSTATQSSEPVLILDGARIQQRPGEVLSRITPDQVTRIEIIRGSAGAWVHGPGSANGVIRVFTRSSARSSEPSTDPQECGNPFRTPGGT